MNQCYTDEAAKDQLVIVPTIPIIVLPGSQRPLHPECFGTLEIPLVNAGKSGAEDKNPSPNCGRSSEIRLTEEGSGISLTLRSLDRDRRSSVQSWAVFLIPSWEQPVIGNLSGELGTSWELG
eukprot:COSAG02_NODE_26703_length_626_cov_1.914611_1_plen_121_part_10